MHRNARVPQSLAELRSLPPPVATAIVEYLEDDPRFSIRKGDRFEACPYVMDPTCKWTLLKRLGDGSDPGCNAYRSQVKVVSRLPAA
jgi:hypothetical protein